MDGKGIQRGSNSLARSLACSMASSKQRLATPLEQRLRERGRLLQALLLLLGVEGAGERASTPLTLASAFVRN